MKQRKQWHIVWIIAVALSLSAIAAAPTQAAESQVQLDVAQLPQLAESGRFDELLTRLRGDELATSQSAVQSLIQDLERYQVNESERTAKRQEAYNKAVAKMGDQLASDRLEDALVAAIEAHGLADDPAALLNSDRAQELIARTEKAAHEAEDHADWVQALSLYRLLDLLFDDHATYRDDVKRASQHVRVLQVYAPKRLQTLYAEKIKRDRAAVADDEEANAEKKDPPIMLDAEQWDQRLKNIELPMLRQTLAQTARKHIAGQSYTPLMQGAVDALLVLVNTRGLEETFPIFNDKEKVSQFRSYLERLSASLKAPDKELGFLESATIIDRIMVMNDRSLALPERVVVYEMTEGATSKLDEFSSVIWPQEIETFSRSTRGKFYGIGIQISRRDGRLVVVSPLANTPAQQAGIKAGDIIATVDGRDTSTWSLDRAVREITGPEGTKVTLGIERVGEKDPLEYDIRRAEIVIESIRGWKHTDGGGWDYWIDRDQHIGYVRLSQFIPQTADDLDAAIEQLEKDAPLRGLILDLRFNPGGLLSSAVDVADRFIPEGPLVFTADAQGNRTQENRAKRHRTYRPFPVMVLVNQGSASASEIVSGALQDYGRATIVGTRSFGKGSVQDLFPLDGGKAYLKLTTQYYMLPQGRIIHRKPDAEHWGIEPDLVVEMTNQQVADSLELRQEVDVIRSADEAAGGNAPNAGDLLTKGLDPQLESAMLVLKTRLVAQNIAIAQANAATSSTP